MSKMTTNSHTIIRQAGINGKLVSCLLLRYCISLPFAKLL